jgi:membrane protein DedA with SNARE-associated domain
MIDIIMEFINRLPDLINLNNPVSLAVIFGMVVFAEIGIIIPFIIEPALFLLTLTLGPLSVPVLLFVLMMTLGRQIGTSIVYWVSRLVGERVGKFVRRLFPRFSDRFLNRIHKFEKRLGKRQAIALATARLTPGLVQISTIAAGALRIRYPIVLAGAFMAGIIYDGTLVIMGALAHYGFRGVNKSYSIWIALGLTLIVGLITFIIGRVRREKD